MRKIIIRVHAGWGKGCYTRNDAQFLLKKIDKSFKITRFVYLDFQNMNLCSFGFLDEIWARYWEGFYNCDPKVDVPIFINIPKFTQKLLKEVFDMRVRILKNTGRLKGGS